MKKITLLITVLFSINQILLSQVLSEWRNLGRTGIYEETNLLKEWPEEGPKLLWSNDHIPEGFSSVSIANNTLFLTGTVDKMDVLVALDLNGALLWKTPYGRSWTGPYPISRCTPTIENDRAYVSSGLGDIACVNSSTGDIIWKMNASEKFEGTFGGWGIAESLLIVDNKLIYSPGGKKTTIVALNKKTGEVIWKSESLHDTPAYVSPLLVEKGTQKIIITVLSNYLIMVDAKNGAILSKYNYAAQDNEVSVAFWNGGPYTNTNTPIYNNGNIYVTSGYDHIGAMFDVSDDFKSLRLKWINRDLDVHHGGVVLVDGFIYGSNWVNNSNGNWCCIDWKTGETKYQKKWITKGSIISADDLLYCYEERTGNIAMVEASPTGFNIVSSFKVPLGSGPHWSHPVINDGILYVRHGNSLMAYNIKEK